MAFRLSPAIACVLVVLLSGTAEGRFRQRKAAPARAANNTQSKVNRTSFLVSTWSRARQMFARQPRPERLDEEGFAELGGRRLSSYFGKDRTLEQLDVDVRRYLYNFSLVHTGRTRGLREHDQLVDEWTQIKTAFRHAPPDEATGQKTLRDFILDIHAKLISPKKKSPRRVTLRRAAMRVVWFPVKLALKTARGVASFLGGSMKITFAVTVGAALLGFVLNPVAHNITAQLNEHFGWVSVGVQRQITEVDLWWHGNEATEAVADLEGARQKFEELHRKYRIGGISEAEAIRLWGEIEETSLLYSVEVSAVLPENIKDGRYYYREGNIVFPVYFATAAATVNNERMLQELRLDTLDARTAGRTLTIDEAAERQRLLEGIEQSKQRMGAILAMWRVNEIFYPEFSRANFMTNNPDLKPLMLSYETFTKGLRFDAYAEAYLEEFGKQLDLLGIPRGAGSTAL
jgi:hypothetical protein